MNDATVFRMTSRHHAARWLSPVGLVACGVSQTAANAAASQSATTTPVSSAAEPSTPSANAPAEPDYLASHRAFLGVFLAIMVVCCGVATTGCSGGSAAQLPPFGSGLPKVTASPEVRSLEHRMSMLVNRDRKKNHLPPLAYDERLADAARSQSADMTQHHFFDHTSPTWGNLEQRLTRAGYLYFMSRENLAEAPNIDEAEEGLLRSPHHYENLMATDITSIGIGIVKGGPNDARNLAVTQIFAAPGKSESDAEAGLSIEKTIHTARGKANMAGLPRLARLDALAKRHLEAMTQDLTESNLRSFANAVTEELANAPIAKITRLSVGGQVIVDSSQFQPQGALLQGSAKGFGMATSHTKDASGARRLKVLFLVGL
jgi:uncharacterized protein YkwD